MVEKLLELDADLRRKRAAIVGFLELAEKDLDVAKVKGNAEGVVTYQYLVGEYQLMLEEFDEYHEII